MIYFDNAATSGIKPKPVIEAVQNCLNRLSANPGRSGHNLSLEADKLIYNCRAKIADFFGADGPENVIFMPNCTTALNTVIKGVTAYNDHVVCSSLEHNSVARPIETLRKRGLIDYDIAEVIFGDNDATVRSFKKAIRRDTKLVVCTHASNVTGTVLPIEEIGKECKKKNILFCVDAAQSAGVLPINMKEMNIDYLCLAPHKGLFAPMGTGILIARKPINNTIIEGGTGSKSMLTIQSTEIPEGFESGTVNLPGIAGISAGIDFVKAKGVENIYHHEMQIAKEIYERLIKIDLLQFYATPPTKNLTVPVISVNVRHKTSSEVADILNRNNIAVRAGLHCAPMAHKRLGTLENGTVRIAPSIFNTKEDINRLIWVFSRVNNY